MAQSIGGVQVELLASAVKYISDIEKAARATQTSAAQMAASFNQTGAAVGRLEQQTSVASRGIARISSSMGAVSSAVRLAMASFAALGVALGVQKIIQFADSWTLAEAQLKLVAGSTTSATAIHEKLFSVAQRLGVEVDALTTIYTRTARAAGGLGVSEEEVLLATEALAAAIRVSGASAEEAGPAIVQLSQAFARGALQGQELHSVSTQFPVVLDAVAQATGKTRQEVIAFATQHGLAADIVIRSLIRMRDQWVTQAASMGSTVGQAVQRVIGSIEKLAGVAEQSGAFNPLIDSLNRFASALSDPRIVQSMQQFGSFIVGMAQAVVTDLIPALQKGGEALATGFGIQSVNNIRSLSEAFVDVARVVASLANVDIPALEKALGDLFAHAFKPTGGGLIGALGLSTPDLDKQIASLQQTKAGIEQALSGGLVPPGSTDALNQRLEEIDAKLADLEERKRRLGQAEATVAPAPVKPPTPIVAAPMQPALPPLELKGAKEAGVGAGAPAGMDEAAKRVENFTTKIQDLRNQLAIAKLPDNLKAAGEAAATLGLNIDPVSLRSAPQHVRDLVNEFTALKAQLDEINKSSKLVIEVDVSGDEEANRKLRQLRATQTSDAATKAAADAAKQQQESDQARIASLSKLPDAIDDASTASMELGRTLTDVDNLSFDTLQQSLADIAQNIAANIAQALIFRTIMGGVGLVGGGPAAPAPTPPQPGASPAGAVGTVATTGAAGAAGGGLFSGIGDFIKNIFGGGAGGGVDEIAAQNSTVASQSVANSTVATTTAANVTAGNLSTASQTVAALTAATSSVATMSVATMTVASQVGGGTAGGEGGAGGAGSIAAILAGSGGGTAPAGGAGGTAPAGGTNLPATLPGFGEQTGQGPSGGPTGPTQVDTMQVGQMGGPGIGGLVQQIVQGLGLATLFTSLFGGGAGGGGGGGGFLGLQHGGPVRKGHTVHVAERGKELFLPSNLPGIGAAATASITQLAAQTGLTEPLVRQVAQQRGGRQLLGLMHGGGEPIASASAGVQVLGQNGPELWSPPRSGTVVSAAVLRQISAEPSGRKLLETVGRAKGGPVHANRPYLVGEAGEELYLSHPAAHYVGFPLKSDSFAVIQRTSDDTRGHPTSLNTVHHSSFNWPHIGFAFRGNRFNKLDELAKQNWISDEAQPWFIAIEHGPVSIARSTPTVNIHGEMFDKPPVWVPPSEPKTTKVVTKLFGSDSKPPSWFRNISFASFDWLRSNKAEPVGGSSHKLLKSEEMRLIALAQEERDSLSRFIDPTISHQKAKPISGIAAQWFAKSDFVKGESGPVGFSQISDRYAVLPEQSSNDRTTGKSEIRREFFSRFARPITIDDCGAESIIRSEIITGGHGLDPHPEMIENAALQGYSFRHQAAPIGLVGPRGVGSAAEAVYSMGSTMIAQGDASAEPGGLSGFRGAYAAPIGLAAGGTMLPDRLYRVGERGPETLSTGTMAKVTPLNPNEDQPGTGLGKGQPIFDFRGAFSGASPGSIAEGMNAARQLAYSDLIRDLQRRPNLRRTVGLRGGVR